MFWVRLQVVYGETDEADRNKLRSRIARRDGYPNLRPLEFR